MRAPCVLVSVLLVCGCVYSQQVKTPVKSGDGLIHLDVVVTGKSGDPVDVLQAGDFSVLDNKVALAVTKFQARGGGDEPVYVTLLIDDVNASYQMVAQERDQLDRFLLANGGKLAHPTTLAIFTDEGTQIQHAFATDGKAMAAMLDQTTVGLKSLPIHNGAFGADERMEKSISALRLLLAKEAGLPGRKLILWVSPGWPLLSGPGIELDGRQEEQIFREVVGLSTEMRRDRITLDDVNPVGPSEGLMQSFYYQDYLKGVSKPSQAQLADLGLQVLAEQSGGLVLNGNNDLAAMVEKCVADAKSYYEISFQGSMDEKTVYHKVEVKVDKPGLVARTRQGYYAEP
jgi:VWFA-related protein